MSFKNKLIKKQATQERDFSKQEEAFSKTAFF